MTTHIKKIVFIEPKSPGFHVYSKWGLPRLGTIILGTILKERGYDVKVFVEDIKGINFWDVFEADAVGISTITSTAPRAYEIANLVRKEGIPVFMGGPHVTFLSDEALEHCDYVFRGEAEDVIVPFIEALEKGSGFESIPNLSYRRDDGTVVNNPEAERCLELDRFPIPDHSLIHGNTKQRNDQSVTPVMTSRGCPFGCTFCSVTRMFGRRYRFRSVGNVVDELEALSPKWTFFYDDNFAANRKHTKELLREMIRRGVKTKWMAQVRIDVVKDAELLELMKKSGCCYVYIGLESINPATLEALNKSQTVEDIENSIRIIHSYGIKIHGMFIFGADQDDIATLRRTVKFAKRLKLESVQFMVLTPLPGTPVFNDMEAEGRLISRDWGYYDAHHVVFQPRGMSYWHLQKETFKAMLRFYSWGQILGRFFKFDLWTMFIRAYGRRFVRRGKRATRDFQKQLKDLYKHAGGSVHQAGQQLQLKARKTSDDIRESLKGINLDRIRRLKAARHGRLSS
jgi:radical SAM superfamily enzyme YgiQ (UPF0313 family)